MDKIKPLYVINEIMNTIEVTNVLGRFMLMNEVSVSSQYLIHKSQYSINVSTLSSGIYFIKATDKNGNAKVGKFVKE